MSNQKWDAQDFYYSGQGVVLAAARDSTTGQPLGFRAIGNCSAAEVRIETTTLEHKESHTGQRGTDVRLVTETKAQYSMTMEKFDARNLATVLRGAFSDIAAGSVTDVAYKGYPGLVTGLNHVKVSSVVVKIGASTLVDWVNDTTAWDYKVNQDAGSIMLNDGSNAAALPATAAYALSVTAGTVGATTSLTVANSFAVGDTVRLFGFTGTHASDLNGKEAQVVTASGTAITVNIDTTGRTITFTTGKVIGPSALLVSYSYVAQKKVDALTVGPQEICIRFEGLNTVDGNNPVVVDLFKVLVDPTEELSLISDEIQQFVLAGSLLADTTKTSGSQFFNQKLLR